MKRTLTLFCFVAALILAAAGGWFLRDGTLRITPHPSPAPAPVANVKSAKIAPVAAPRPDGASGSPKTKAAPSSTPGAALPVLTEDLGFALGEKTFSAQFRCNGRDRLQVTGTNLNAQPLKLLVPAGQVFESANGSVVVLRDRLMEFRPGEARSEEVPTLAAASSNRVSDEIYAVSATPQPKLQPLLDYVAEHHEVSTAAAQTAALVIFENLPASAFAKFAVAGSDVPGQWDTTAFKVDVADLVQALLVLREIGIPDEQLAITVDPQTRIEAMLDPLAHAMAMRYYGIEPKGEWAYWKHELLEGEPSTRHYALHGIARYFPDVALPMLPQWARESRTSLVFRKAAIQALAETRRVEALSVLKGLESELGPETELGKAATQAADYLDTVLNKQGTDAKKDATFRVVGGS